MHPCAPQVTISLLAIKLAVFQQFSSGYSWSPENEPPPLHVFGDLLPTFTFCTEDACKKKLIHIKFAKHIHDPDVITPHDFNDPATFPPCGQATFFAALLVNLQDHLNHHRLVQHVT